MKRFKQIIYKILGQEKYLQLLAYMFPYFYRLGLLKNNPEYAFHYYVRKLIKPQDTVIDIGANLGYYSRIFAELTKNGGKLISIEPVLPFYKILKKSVQQYQHCTAYNYALGKEEKQVVLTIPGNYGYIRTGLASVTEPSATNETDFSFPAEMKKASDFIGQFSPIHYIKCDIEGYESVVIPEIRAVLEQHQPLLQIETSGENKIMIEKMMHELGYSCYSLYQGKLVKDLADNLHYGDYLFVHESKKDLTERL